jgi:two-component system, chemotaxis family, CheB/CheR fusion protein
MAKRNSTRQVRKAGKAGVAKKRPAKPRLPQGRKAPAKREPPRPGSPALVAPVGKAKKKEPGPTVVGIGASAGGFTALKEFFAHVPPDSGLAYVVVVHLSPEHESHLAPLLQPYTQLEVHQVSETVPLTANCVYVIPPNANLNTIDTHLRLSALEERRQERAPIDHFFRTLAETHDGRGIGVILTGTGSDGTRGIKEIKLRGGLTIVQDPKEAEYDGMPQSALATGFVDLVLPLARIPEAAIRFARTEPKLPAPGDDEKMGSTHRLLLQKIFTQVRARTNRDFTRYKRSTVMRRIHRRMQLRYIEDLNRYVELLRNTPAEVLALSDDLLITVTSFFRDPKVFDALQNRIIPKLFADKQPEDEIRVWCVGCATGEEVYSVAMLMLEEAARRDGLAPSLHLFASDLHDRSLDVAREGFYPGDIAAEVSPERLKRFFREETGGYRIRKELRDTVVFAPHNLLNDPPFGRLDLLLCRNLLIYLQREIQSDVLRVFHYALRPGGMLVLGSAETVDNAEYFRTFDKENSIYRRGEAQHSEARLPVFPIMRRAKDQDGAEIVSVLPSRYQAMHQEMVMQNAAASVLVGPDGQVVHVAGDAARFLAHPVGRMTTSAVKLVRKEF